MQIDTSIRARWYGPRLYKGKRYGVEAIIFHYTANTGSTATARSNANYFATTDRQASAHYVVDSGETAYQCVPEEMASWAVGDGQSGEYGKKIGNHNSISIEMVSCTDAAGRFYIPERTQERAAELYRELKKRYPQAFPLRHYDISRKPCPAPMVDEAAWAEFKEVLDLTGEEIYRRLNEHLKTLDAPDWAQEELEQAKELGITDGSKPMALIPRYQAAIMCKRAVEAALKK